MVLSQSFLSRLDGDPEMVEALMWIGRKSQRYAPGRFTPPLRAKTEPDDPKRFVAVSFRLGRLTPTGGGLRVRRLDWYDGETVRSCDDSGKDIAERVAGELFTSRMAGTLIVTTGKRRAVLDVFLENLGPKLLKLGYELQPCLTSGAVSFIKLRKGKRTWTIAYLEGIAGAPLATLEAIVPTATRIPPQSTRLAERLYAATAAYASFLSGTFGVALRPTCGMIAMSAARQHFPASMSKWRPDSLLVGMSRAGLGYRAGVTYAKRYRGPTYRIDVNRQYTGALTAPLPVEARFGRYDPNSAMRNGIYLCRVRKTSALVYPFGVWSGATGGFQYFTEPTGTFLSVLHTAEIEGLRAFGIEIEPWYGFGFTKSVSLDSYVKRLQGVLFDYGRDSPQSKLAKPLGNYIYGKFAQKSTRLELLFTDEQPSKDWYPYWDDQGKQWEQVWERTSTHHTAAQHIDIAGVITATARSQTLRMWAWLEAAGCQVVRVHTDSITTDVDPTGLIDCEDDIIGGWRLESESEDSTVVYANAYFSDGEAHIAGVSEPTYEMIDHLYDGHVVHVAQQVNAPRRGWQRDAIRVSRQYGVAR